MKKIFAFILGILAMNSQAENKIPEDVYLGLRSQVLNLTSEEFGVNKQNFPYEVWGLIMETGVKQGSYTLVTLADGTTSIYYSTGGGIIGAGAHESVQEVSKILLSGANHFHDAATVTTDYPLPEQGQTNFYFLGYDGVKKYTALESDLGNNKDRLSKLFHAAHMVIARVRETQKTTMATKS
ncbi:MAG: hypothetical protein R3213_10580 [Flavobacteriaceae bacterium]|nr:hypothetical protein [Flavobacteriaceae bacterium]